MDELTRFLNVWEQETAKTAKLLNCLPRDQYDFRPDAGGRSLGELAWHLAEGDAYITHGIERGQFDFGAKPAGIERPQKGRRARAGVRARAPRRRRARRETQA